MITKVVAIVGSYRRGGTIDSAVEAILEGAREKGAITHTIHLTDQHIEFCKNCRQCTQTPGEERGKCCQEDDLEALLAEIDAADAVVLGSPVNYGNVTAIFRRFMERIIGFTYWPWSGPAPKPRKKLLTRKAVLVASSAMPGFLIPLVTGTGHALRTTAKLLGAKPVGSLWVGLSAQEPDHQLSPRAREQARHIGWKLALMHCNLPLGTQDQGDRLDGSSRMSIPHAQEDQKCLLGHKSSLFGRLYLRVLDPICASTGSSQLPLHIFVSDRILVLPGLACIVTFWSRVLEGTSGSRSHTNHRGVI
jgi:putative NADPH-quinone reductase